MTIIQTFCSFNQPLKKTKFGWYAAYYHLVSWALSCHTLRQFYDDIILYTDDNGYDTLIRKLQLPYTAVITNHHVQPNYHKASWALAKLKTFSVQTTPFLHVDGDVFIRQPFDPALLNAPVIVQNLEKSSHQYERNLNHAKKYLRYLPVIMHADIQQGDTCSCNAGIIGGSDLELFHELSQLAFGIAEQNAIHRLHRNVLLNINVLLEQVMLYRLLLQQGRQPRCLFEEVFYDFGYTTNDVADLSGSNPYTHLVGGHKRTRKTCEAMEQVLQQTFPEAHERITHLFGVPRTTVFSPVS